MLRSSSRRRRGRCFRETLRYTSLSKKECSTKRERERPDKSCKSNFPQAETPAVASLGNELLGRFRRKLGLGFRFRWIHFEPRGIFAGNANSILRPFVVRLVSRLRASAINYFAWLFSAFTLLFHLDSPRLRSINLKTKEIKNLLLRRDKKKFLSP